MAHPGPSLKLPLPVIAYLLCLVFTSVYTTTSVAKRFFMHGIAVFLLALFVESSNVNVQ